MLVVINRLKVKPGFGPAVIERFAASHGLEQTPGFVRFRLLEQAWSPGTLDAHEYLSMTEWTTREAFEAWVKSDAFRRAHAGGDSGMFAGPAQVVGYTAAVERTPETPTRSTGNVGGVRAVAMLLLAMLGLFFGIAGCSEASGADRPAAQAEAGVGVTFVDDTGRTIVLQEPAERVVAGASFAVELLMALEHPPVLRPAVPERKLHPASARSIPTFAVQHGAGPETESIAVAEPDLVILHTNFAPFAPNIQRALGVPVALLEVTSIEDVGRKLELLGDVIGKQDVAAERRRSLESEIRRVTADAPEQGPRVIALFGTPEAFFAYRQTSYLGSMLDALGAENVAATDASVSGIRSVAPLKMEQVIARAPEVVVIVPHGPQEAVMRGLTSHPAWSQIPAVRNGQVHVLDEALFSSNPGPRAPEAMRKLKALLHADPS